MSESITTLAHKFLKIMLENRKELSNFLLKWGQYDNITKIICKAEEIYSSKHTNDKKYPLLKNFMLGNMGYLHNSKMAIYELPTLELISLVVTLCNISNTNTVIEMSAGLGLFSKLLSSYYDTYYPSGKPVICATDNGKLDKTSGPYYYPISSIHNKDFIDSIETRRNGIIMVWPDTESSNHSNINYILEKSKPTFMMIVGDKYFYKYDKFAVNPNYNSYCIDLKLIGHRDNTEFFGKFSHSSILLIVKNTLPEVTEDSSFVEYLLKHCDSHFRGPTARGKLTLDSYIISPQELMKELVLIGKMPKLVASFDDPTIYSIAKKIKMHGSYFSIPQFVETDDEFYFLLNVYIKTGISPEIKSRDKFIRFEKLYSQTLESNQEGMNNLIAIGAIPPMLAGDRTGAQKYLIEEYIK
jgi:hypothetical protein